MPAVLPAVQPPEGMTEQYYDAYCAAAQMLLSTREHARTWWALAVGAEVAGAWARHGFTPAQAWPWIGQGVTPEAAAAQDPPPRA
jgi:hypothetical protein